MRAPFFGLHCWKLTQDSGMPYNEKNKSFAARLCLSYSEVPYTNKIVFIAAIFMFGILAVGNTVVKNKRWLVHASAYLFMAFYLGVGILASVGEGSVQERTQKHMFCRGRCASAVEKLKGSDGTMYDQILMDIQMPGMNGHIAKPVEIPKLLNMLGKILG